MHSIHRSPVSRLAPFSARNPFSFLHRPVLSEQPKCLWITRSFPHSPQSFPQELWNAVMKHFAVIVQKQNQHKIFTSVFIFGALYFFTIAFSLCKNYPLDRRQRRRTMTLWTLYRYMGALTCPQPRILGSTQLSGISHCRGLLEKTHHKRSSQYLSALAKKVKKKRLQPVEVAAVL